MSLRRESDWLGGGIGTVTYALLVQLVEASGLSILGARAVGEILSWASVLQNELIRVCSELEG